MFKGLPALVILLTSLSTPLLANSATESKPLILAHRASSGLWIQNSRNAVENTVALFQQNPAVFHGIEVDIVLTKDLVPVLSHDPWVHRRLCKRRDGTELGTALVKDITLSDLQQNYVCGADTDSDFPSASTKAESVLDLKEFLTIVKQAPELIIYLDLKIQAPLTVPAEQYGQSIFALWQQFAMPNPLYIEGPNTEAIQAFDRYGVENVTTVLSYPPYWANKNAKLTGIAATIGAYIQPQKALKKALKAHANAVASPTSVANKRLRKNLKQHGKAIIVFTPNTFKAIAKVCASGVDILITDHPTLGPCR